MKVEIDIDPAKFGLRADPKSEELYEALNSLYSKIWCEACYDPTNDSMRNFAKSLLADIQKINEILKFKD